MFKKPMLLGCLSFLAAAAVCAPAVAQALKKVHTTVPRNSVFVLSTYGAKDAGIYAKHGIDLTIDPRPFRGHVAGLPAKEAMVTYYPGTAAIARINKGLDWVIIGGGLTVMQEVMVRNETPFKAVPDLRGKKFSSWSTGAGAFKATRAALIDAYGIDVLKDTDFVQAAAPALFKFLESGKVDSMFNISSLTVAALAQPDRYRSIFSANAYWKKKSGYPVVWSAPIVAWRSWVEEDPDRAKRFVAASHESWEWLRDPKNLDATVKKHGKLAAVKNQAQADVYRRLLSEKRVFLTDWNPKVVDAQWAFLEMAQKRGVIDKVPAKDKHGLILK